MGGGRAFGLRRQRVTGMSVLYVRPRRCEVASHERALQGYTCGAHDDRVNLNVLIAHSTLSLSISRTAYNLGMLSDVFVRDCNAP